MVKIDIRKSVIDAINLDSLVEYITWAPHFAKYFVLQGGQEIYKLLAAISNQLPDDSHVSDVGTFIGSSALALSFNEKVQVMTYDTTNHIMKSDGTKTIAFRPNIKRTIVSGQAVISKIAESLVVMLDIDPHDGIEEAKFINKLRHLGFKGLLVVDNININSAMKTFWQNVPKDLKKIDVTDIGHWVGTGIIVFDPDTIDIIN